MFCCGARRRRKRRSKYEAEHPQALQVVHVDSDGSAYGVAKEKGNKKSAEKEAKKSDEGKGENMKQDDNKHEYENYGYESDNKNKVCIALLMSVHYACT